VGMANAIIKYGDDGGTFAVVLPDGEETDALDLDLNGITLLDDESDPSAPGFLVLTSAYGGGLKPNTVYQLTALDTDVETDVDLDYDDESDEEEYESDDEDEDDEEAEEAEA